MQKTKQHMNMNRCKLLDISCRHVSTIKTKELNVSLDWYYSCNHLHTECRLMWDTLWCCCQFPLLYLSTWLQYGVDLSSTIQTLSGGMSAALHNNIWKQKYLRKLPCPVLPVQVHACALGALVCCIPPRVHICPPLPQVIHPPGLTPPPEHSEHEATMYCTPGSYWAGRL